jgi:Protein of unknown function (DUF3344)
MHAPISRAARLLCATVALALLAAPAHAADAPFTPRFATTAPGDVTAVGNTLMTCPGSCAAAQSSTTANDNDYVMARVNIDNDGTNFDSSSATVTLPPSSTVLWAGLYWAADVNAGTGGAAAPTAANKGAVRFRGPSGGYQTVTAAPADVLTSSLQPSRYRGYADVTSLVTAGGGGTYTVGNVQAATGNDRFAGWALFVAYRNNAQPIRRLSVYDGLGTVQNGTSFSTTIAPFHTPATGTVTTKAGLLTFEGDAGIPSETATFNGQALSDALNLVGNVMNSTIEAGGQPFTAKNPNYANQLGMDLDVFSNPGALANDQSSASLAFSSTNEYFMPAAFFLVSDEGPATSTGAGPTIAPPAGGVAHDGQTLSADPGTWNGTGTLTYSYQWQQCDANGANCRDIVGATSSTYTPTADDVGGTVRVVVTATNAAGTSAPTVSAPIAIKASSAPVNTARPALAGPVSQGQALSVDPGSWNGPGTSYTYAWQRCDAAGANCVAITGANDATYTPTANDVGHTLRAVVTATNDAGTATTTTVPSAVVTAGADPNDLSGVAGGLLGETSCQQLVGGAKYRRVALAGIGTVRVRAYTSGPALSSSPLRLTTEVTGGRARSVRYVFDGRPVAASRGVRYPAALAPSQIGRVGRHTLKTAVRGPRGAAKTVSLTLTTQPCQTLFTAQRWRTTAGAGLRLRLDSRTALRQLSFSVPSALLPTQTGARRAAGFIRLYVAGRSRPVRYPLTLPARGARSVMLAASGRPTVSLTRNGVRVTQLPARAAVAEVTLYRVTKLDRATSRRAYTVRVTVNRDAAGAQTLSAKPKPPR